MVEPWMLIAAGLVVLAGVFVVITRRRQLRLPQAGMNDAEKAQSDETPHPMQPPGTPVMDESFVIRTDPRGREVLGTQRRDAHILEDARAAGAKVLDRLVADVKSHADKRVGELDVLIAQAKRHVEELQRQSAELAKTLQTARNEAARRQAVAIERAAVARAIADCESLAAACVAPATLVTATGPTATPPVAASPVATSNPAVATTATVEHTDTWPIPAQRPSATATAEHSATPNGAFVGSRHREVLRLLDQDNPLIEISKTLGLEIGEVELIANLNGRRPNRTI